MKTYVEFYQYGIDWKNTGIKPIVPILGTEGIFPLDNRLSRFNAIEKAKEVAKNHFRASHIIGFKLLSGSSILNAKEITELILL